MRIGRPLRQNLVLAAAVAALAITTWIVIDREQQAAQTPLTTIDTARVTALRVVAGDKPAREFERRDGRWWMRAPYVLPAHADAVARLVAIAAAPTRSRHAPDHFDASRIGLAPPQAILEIGGQQLAFGITDAIRGDRYVRTPDAIALMPDRFSGWLLAPAESEIDHRLAEPLVAVDTVLIDGIAQPALAAAWNRVTTSQVIAADTAAPPGPAIRVRLTDANGQAIDYTLHRRDDGRYLAVRGEPALAYPLDEAQLQQLLPPAGANRTLPVP